MKFSLVRSLFLLPLIVGSLLQAQVDPRLLKGKTDVLDVYFGSTSQGAKPEIISIIDNSTSMTGLYWSPYYYADASVNAEGLGLWHNNAWITTTTNRYLVPVVYKKGSGATVTITVSLFQSQGWDGATLDVYNTPKLVGGLLIKPDGSPVTYLDAGSSDVPEDWVQRASHVRFAITSKASATYVDPVSGGTFPVPNVSYAPRPIYTSGTTADYTTNAPGAVLGAGNIRVVDIPLPWGAFDAVPYYEGQNIAGVGPDGTTSPGTYKRPLVSSQGTTPPSPDYDYATAIAKKHPQHSYVYDPGLTPPTSADSWYEVDSVWSSGAYLYKNGVVPTTGVMSSGLLQATGTMNWIGGSPAVSGTYGSVYGKVGMCNYSPDYLWWCFFGQDVRNQTGGVSPTGKYNSNMVDIYTGSNVGGYAVADVRENGAGFKLHDEVAGNGLPCLTKFMAIKKALFTAYVANQNDVHWAIRFLSNDPATTASSPYNSSNTIGQAWNRMLLMMQPCTSSHHPDANSVRYVAGMSPSVGTPLNAAMMNAYAQMANPSNGNSVFAADTDACTKSYVIVLSDGRPNDNGSGLTDPFKAGSAGGTALVGASVAGLKGGSFCDIGTIAGVAAHQTSVPGTTGWDVSNANKVPVGWPITTRGASASIPRYTSTITIGVGLAGSLLDPTGSKRGMYAAATYGWEARKLYNIDPLSGQYAPPDPYLSTPTATSKDVNPFFFDANSPDALSAALSTAISLTRAVTNTMGAPVAPLVGLSVGKQIYLGIFNTPSGAIWNGDLLMTGLSVNGNSVTILDKSGTAATSSLSQGNAVWSAADAVFSKSWKYRNLFTLTPDPTNLPLGPSHPGAFLTTSLPWNEGTSDVTLPNSVLGVGTTQARLALIRFMMGAIDAAQNDTAAVSSITANRTNIMGDIINSTPAILEFPMSMVPASSSTLSGWPGNANPPLASLPITNQRFRLILVGDNQGILHGFGEVSGFDTQGHLQGVVDELWGFIPPDFLIGLNAWIGSSQHTYLMDGSPIAYLNEQGTPDGIVNGSDVVRVVFGLGKGGRSVYSLSFNNNDPNQPYIAWKLRPDEYTGATSGADLAIKQMGFSTSNPAPSRIQLGDTLQDVVFIGGGLSTKDVDTAFSASKTATPAGFGAPTQLGHSILAVDLLAGGVVKYWDFYNDTSLVPMTPATANWAGMGCIPANVVPFEALLGSFRTQRVYFSDANGGVSVLGAKASSGLRSDTSDINNWSVRKIYTPSYAGTTVSTPPAPFYLPNGYPITRTVAPLAMTSAVGVTFQTGDRNDPMDNDLLNPHNNTAPNRNRLITILDRQDSADITASGGKADFYGFTDVPTVNGDLADLTAVASTSDTNIAPSYSYLKKAYGYQLQFALGTAKSSGGGYFYEKGVTAPIVLNGSLFFSRFTPATTSSLCSGSGTTFTFRMCDVLNPIYNNGGQANASNTNNPCSGWYVSYNDIPSQLASVGLGAVIQAGEIQNSSLQGQGIIGLSPVAGTPINKILRPRAWRIVR